MKFKTKRCIVCQVSFEPKISTQILCSDIRCKQHLKNKRDSERSRNRTIERRLVMAQQIMKEYGYLVIPPNSSHRIILEPVEAQN